VFKIIGDGAFAKALTRIIQDRNGTISDYDYTWIIPCVPSYALPEVGIDIDKKILFVSKGILRAEHKSHLVSEWAKQIGYKFAYLSGPHLAHELQSGLDSMSTIAATNRSMYDEIKHYFPNPSYSSNIDLLCLAGVVKNIIAYASGLYAAAGWGENVRACIITGSLRELSNLAGAMGIKFDHAELLQPGILADLILTGTSSNSRNFKAGYNKYKGLSHNELTESHHSATALIDRIKQSEKWPLISLVAHSMEADQLGADLLSQTWQKLCENCTTS